MALLSHFEDRSNSVVGEELPLILAPSFGHETGLSKLGEWPRIWPPWGAQGRTQSMLRAAQA